MKKQALLVVSFGTSYAATREKTITATENALTRVFAQYDLRRAFTSQIVIAKLKRQDGIVVDTVTQAMEKLYAEDYQEILVQPLHIIPGYEYEEMIAELVPYVHKFPRLAVGRPLLAGDDDYKAVTAALRDAIPPPTSTEAVVFMGHGSSHPANAAYSKLDSVFKEHGFPNVHVATVEGTPGLDAVTACIEAGGIRKVTLMPFMLVAGDHALNDMAGDEEGSWKTILERNGYTVTACLVGLGEIETIRQIYVAHARAALKDKSPWIKI